ncbi:MAG: 50S ribosomal protein L5 [Candidatus Paceibacterota bacterium]|jgi:large subunit ribosomal protein L5
MKNTTLRESYTKEIAPALARELGVKNVHATPRIKKIVVNVGVGRASQAAGFSDKILPEISKELAIITGQRPAPRGAKKSIAGFKLRQGQVVGLQVTLRGARMYGFLDKIVKATFPRVRDFRGLDLKNVDKTGNLNFGFREHVVFPEISQDASSVDFGLQITCVVHARTRQDAIALYKKIGFLFKKQ